MQQTISQGIGYDKGQMARIVADLAEQVLAPLTDREQSTLRTLLAKLAAAKSS